MQKKERKANLRGGQHCLYCQLFQDVLCICQQGAPRHTHTSGMSALHSPAHAYAMPMSYACTLRVHFLSSGSPREDQSGGRSPTRRWVFRKGLISFSTSDVDIARYQSEQMSWTHDTCFPLSCCLLFLGCITYDMSTIRQLAFTTLSNYS